MKFTLSMLLIFSGSYFIYNAIDFLTNKLKENQKTK